MILNCQCKVDHCTAHPITVDLFINGKKVKMEVDTGAAVTIISERVRKKFFPKEKLRPSSLLLRTYTGEAMPVVADIQVQVKYGDQQCTLDLTVVCGAGSSLLGQDWLQHLRLDWKMIGFSKVGC